MCQWGGCMTIRNPELGKLLWYLYYVHVDTLEEAPFGIPRYYFYENHGLTEGKKYKDGCIWVNVLNEAHFKTKNVIYYCIMRNVDENQKPEVTYTLHADSLENIVIFDKVNYLEDDYFDFSSDAEVREALLSCYEFLGCSREYILEVLNGNMTAKEAYEKNEYKNILLVSYLRRLFVFDGNVAVKGDFSGISMDEFPFPFDGVPILDCSKVRTSSIDCSGKKVVKLIHVNDNYNSIRNANLTSAIIEEEINPLMVDCEGTIFNQNIKLNMDLYERIVSVDQSEYPIIINCAASDIQTMEEGLDAGADGVGLFRGEVVLESNPELIKRFFAHLKNRDYDLYDSYYEAFYQYIFEMVRLSRKKDIVFRLTDIKLDELARIVSINSGYDVSEYKGSKGLWKLIDLFEEEITAIIRVGKECDRSIKILIPYLDSVEHFILLKEKIEDIAYCEGVEGFLVDVGAMIENKKSVEQIETIAQEADFISIGTNDLTEDVLGIDRRINHSAFSILHDDVKACIDKVVKVAKSQRDIPINVCGEHTNYDANLEYLSSCGVDSITCDSAFVRTYLAILRNKVKQKKIN